MSGRSEIVKWKIENFSYGRRAFRKAIESPSFINSQDNYTPCHLSLYPGGFTELNIMSIYLIYKNSTFLLHVDYVEFSILDCNNCELKTFRETADEMRRHGQLYGCSKFISQEEVFNNKDTYLPEDALTVCCRIEWKNYLSSRPIAERILLRSRVLIRKMSCLSTFENFSTLQGRHEYTLSKLTCFEISLSGVVFLIRNPPKNETIEIAMCSTTRQNALPFATCEVSILDSQGAAVNIINTETSFLKKRHKMKHFLLGFYTIPESSKCNYLPNDSLNLLVKFAFPGGELSEDVKYISINQNLSGD